MTTMNIRTVAQRFVIFGKLSLINDYYNAKILSLLMSSPWSREIIAPSYSSPNSVLWVIGENAFHMMLSQILIAMKSEVPEFPIPYPLERSSSIKSIMTAENTN
jgi:hypothetical protein